MSRHRTLSGKNIHGPYRQIFADDTARLADAETYLASESIAGGSVNPAVALQVDTLAEWILIDHSPTTWSAQTITAAAHALGGASHTSSTLAQLNALISDATLGPANFGSIIGVVLSKFAGGEAPYATIALALAAASSGDIVLVGPGVYAESVTIPADVTLQAAHGMGSAAIVGAVATGTRVTLNNDSLLIGFSILLPTDAVSAISYVGTASNIAEVWDLYLVGAGASGIGIQNVGPAILHIHNIRYVSGVCDAVILISGGSAVIKGIFVGGGTTADALRVTSGASVVIDDHVTDSLATVTDALHVEDASTVIATRFNFKTPINCIHVLNDDADIEAHSCRFTSITNDILVDGGVTTGRLHLTAVEMSSVKINASDAWYATAEWLFTYQDELPGDFAWRIQGGELAVGHSRKGTESSFGEGDSHVIGLAAQRNTNGEIGIWTDISVAMASSASSMAAGFDGVGVGNALFVGGDLQFPGLKINTAAAIAIGSGIIRLRYWNGASWVAVNHMAADGESPFAQYANTMLERIAFEQVRFGAMPGWTTKVENGKTKYYVMLDIITAITTVPTLEQIKLHTNHFEANREGTTEWFGSARPPATLAFYRTLLEDEVGSSPADQNILWSTNITMAAQSNSFANSAVDSRDGEIIIPEGLDTSCPLVLKILWAQSTGAVSADIEWEVRAVSVPGVGTVLDGSASDSWQNVIVATSGIQYQLQETEFTFDVSTLLPGERLVIQILRDARASNLDDLFTAAIYIVDLSLVGTRWRG